MLETLSQLLARAQSLTPGERHALRDDPRLGVQRLLKNLLAQDRRAAAEAQRLQDMLKHEMPLWRRGIKYIAGVDEVGAGPLAGPVYAAAVILPPGTSIAHIDDSKKLSAAERHTLAQTIRKVAVAWAVGACSAAEIDAMNILQASRQAMRRAVTALAVPPEHLLVDARTVPQVRTRQTAIVKGDSHSQSIAAASILAKVERDAVMEVLAQEYPGYGFAEHRGYGTPVHLQALAHLGPCAIHRRSFAPVAAQLQASSSPRPQMPLL